MRVAYLTNQLPFPPRSGGQVREAQLLCRLAAEVDIDLFVLTDSYDRDLAKIELTLPNCARVALFESVPIPPEGPTDDLPERVWRYRSDEFDKQLQLYLSASAVDLVHVEGYFLAGHLPSNLGVPILVVEENIEYLLDCEHETAGRRRGASWQTTRALELEVWLAATVVAGVSAHDVAAMQHDLPHADVMLTPNGFDHLPNAEPRNHKGIGSQVVFVGNYSWAPTRDGAWELVTEIWPRISRVMSEAQLILAGAGLSDELMAAATANQTIRVIGEVESVAPTLVGADLFVCPVRTGSGIKVKMIEAMRAGCAIVCTSAALRGLPESAGSAVVVFDERQEFANGVVRLLGDPVRRNELSRRAAGIIRGLPTWDEAAQCLMHVWQRTAAARQGLSR